MSERLELWQKSVDRFEINPDSPIGTFLKSDILEHILVLRRIYLNARDSVILNSVDQEKRFLMINTYGSRPDAGEDIEEVHPLVDFFKPRGSVYAALEVYLDENGKPIFERVIQSDRSRVPSPSVLIRGRVRNTQFVICQKVTYPHDWEQFYQRIPFKFGFKVVDPDSADELVRFATYYTCPSWNEDSYHCGEESSGELTQIKFSSVFGELEETKEGEEIQKPRKIFKNIEYTDEFGSFRIFSNVDSLVRRSYVSGKEWSSLLVLLASLPSSEDYKVLFEFTFPQRVDIKLWDTMMLDRNIDWRELIDKIPITFHTKVDR